MHFRVKQTIAHVTVLTALIPVAACTGGQVKTQRNPELAPQQVASLRDPDLAPKRGEYSYDTVQSHVVRTTVSGECVQTIYWTTEGATQECHPGLFGRAPAPRAAQPPAPQAVETVTETVEYEAMEYAQAPDYEPAPYVEPPAAAAEAPMEDFYAPGDAPDLVPVPPPSGDEAADDRISEPTMYYEEEVAVVEDDGIAGRSEFFEEEVVETEDGIVGRREYYEEEEEVVQDDGIVSQSEYFEEEEVVQDEGIVARTESYEEEGKQPEDLISEPGAVEEEVVEEKVVEEVVEEKVVEEEVVEEKVVEEEVVEEEVVEEEVVEEEVVEEKVVEEKVVEEKVVEEKVVEEEVVEEEVVEEEVVEEEVVAAAEQEQEAAPEVAAAEQEQAAAPAVAAAEQEQAAAPEVVAAEPAAEPAPAPAAEPTPIMLPITITLEAEPWFDFDRYTIRSDSRDKLDKLVSDLSGIDFDEIVVVGHADPIGTPEYNQVLSERRARAVKSYLVSKGLPGVRIKDEGRGEYDLPFDPALCKGLKKQKLIECLQPDRVVEVTVTGTKPQQ